MMIATQFDKDDKAIAQYVVTAVFLTDEDGVRIIGPDVNTTIGAGHVTTFVDGHFLGKWDARPRMQVAA